MTVIERLEMGAKRIREYGLAKHALRGNSDGSGPGCAVGSMLTDDEFKNRYLADGYCWDKSSLAQEIMTIAQVIGFRDDMQGALNNFVAWNNADECIAEDVITRFELHAGILRAQEFANTP